MVNSDSSRWGRCTLVPIGKLECCLASCRARTTKSASKITSAFRSGSGGGSRCTLRSHHGPRLRCPRPSPARSTVSPVIFQLLQTAAAACNLPSGAFTSGRPRNRLLLPSTHAASDGKCSQIIWEARGRVLTSCPIVTSRLRRSPPGRSSAAHALPPSCPNVQTNGSCTKPWK